MSHLGRVYCIQISGIRTIKMDVSKQNINMNLKVFRLVKLKFSSEMFKQ